MSIGAARSFYFLGHVVSMVMGSSFRVVSVGSET